MAVEAGLNDGSVLIITPFVNDDPMFPEEETVSMRRIYENPAKTSENRLPQRASYIPQGKSEYRLLNGSWRLAFFARDIDVPKNITHWDTMLEGIDSVGDISLCRRGHSRGFTQRKIL